MIGLGSNRLSVCRRGGMSVTQAGRGGMEWLAGYRDPIWASPYSAQATAALKAQFPTQWPTIRDYGFAHPEIVGYMNAYAPEDAKIAYSLVEGIGTRYNCNDATHTGWADTGVIGDENTRLIFTGILLSDISWACACFGADASYNSRNFSSWIRYMQYNSDSIGYGGDQKYDHIGPTPLNKKFTIDANQNHWVNKLEDGTVVWDYTFTQRTFTTPGTMTINAYRRNNSAPDSAGNKGCAICEVFQGDTHKLFVPYKVDGAMKFLDLISGDIATMGGEFYELIETPAS